MQINSTGNLPQLQLRLPAQALQGVSLSDGDSIQAVVREGGSPGSLSLEINGKLLQAISSLRLAAGTVLQLRVEKSADQIVLQLADRDQQQLTMQQALRQILPRQESLKPLFQRLQQLQPSEHLQATKQAEGRVTGKAGRPDISTDTSAPPSRQPLQQAVARLIAALPSIARLGSSDGLTQAIAASGLFMENTLIQAGSPNSLDNDVKTLLLRLARTIRETLQAEQKGTSQSGRAANESGKENLQTLLRQVESSLARIQVNQLHTLSSQHQGDERMSINLEIPFYLPQEKETDVLRLRIQREKNKRVGHDEAIWSVTLHFHPGGYGEIHAIVTLSSGKVSTTFWCEQEQTGRLFRQELETLQHRFAEQGLEVGRCTAVTGKPPETITDSGQARISGLIDTRA